MLKYTVAFLSCVLFIFRGNPMYTIVDNLVLNLFSLVKINIDVNTRKKKQLWGGEEGKIPNFSCTFEKVQRRHCCSFLHILFL
jgi:hypothetical protein